ncbi:hypothetical protein GQ607_010868 [Colletotrichum asianum]|uniref:Uncharacterized protein n=1 Tax=Colletotrichum asianum TaxID=702518 RepID=A0A8H3W9E4_9PEZI|nr:hypothetical protein GQ607_010868 [Colletotrichum asianum]
MRLDATTHDKLLYGISKQDQDFCTLYFFFFFLTWNMA